MARTPIATLKGPRGFTGPRGLPGTNGVATDEAVAENMTQPDTQTGTKLDRIVNASAVPTVQSGVNENERLPIVAYGASFVAEQGLTDASQYYVRRFARAVGLTYPTDPGGMLLNRGRGGLVMEEVAGTVLGDSARRWVPGTKAIVLIDGLGNTIRWRGADPDMFMTSWYSLRAIMNMLGAERIVPPDSTASGGVISYSGSWWGTISSGLWAPGGRFRRAEAVGASFEFTASNQEEWVVFAGREGPNGPVVRVDDVTTGARIDTIDLANKMFGTTLYDGLNVVPYTYMIPEPARGHVVRFTWESGTLQLAFGGTLPQATTKPPVILVKSPKKNDWGASTQYPNGSDAANELYNGLIDTFANAHPNVIAVDSERYWNKEHDLLADGVHATEVGNEHIARAVVESFEAWAARRIVASVVSGEINPVAKPGWVDLSRFAAAGYTASSLRGKIIGSQVYLQGVVSGAYLNGATGLVIATLPEEWRPSASMWGGAYLNNPAAPASAVMRANGTIGVVQRSGSDATTSVQFTISYPLG